METTMQDTMSCELEIRIAERKDRDALRTMQATSFRQLGGSFYDDDVIEAFIGHVGTMDDALLDDGTYFAAFIGGDLVGCGGWSRRSPNYAALMRGDAVAMDPKVATVRSVYVHPGWARRGIGNRIMRHIEAAMLAAGRDRAQLTATLSGIPLYRRLAYRAAEPVALAMPADLRFVGLNMRKRLSLAPPSTLGGRHAGAAARHASEQKVA
jgi:GNAT superfamily N-acetyltransferase